MTVLSEKEQQLLEKLGTEGKATQLASNEIAVAEALERDDCVFLVPDGTGRAVITPKGRRLLVKSAQKPKSTAAPFRYT